MVEFLAPPGCGAPLKAGRQFSGAQISGLASGRAFCAAADADFAAPLPSDINRGGGGECFSLVVRLSSTHAWRGRFFLSERLLPAYNRGAPPGARRPPATLQFRQQAKDGGGFKNRKRCSRTAYVCRTPVRLPYRLAARLPALDFPQFPLPATADSQPPSKTADRAAVAQCPCDSRGTSAGERCNRHRGKHARAGSAFDGG